MTIRIFAQGTVSRENRPEFSEIVNYLVEKVRKTEHGKTLVYDFFLSDSDAPGNCTIHEAYIDGAALSDHVTSLGEDFARVTKVFKTEMMRISGDAPAPVLEALAAVGDLRSYPNPLAEL